MSFVWTFLGFHLEKRGKLSIFDCPTTCCTITLSFVLFKLIDLLQTDSTCYDYLLQMCRPSLATGLRETVLLQLGKEINLPAGCSNKMNDKNCGTSLPMLFRRLASNLQANNKLVLGNAQTCYNLLQTFSASILSTQDVQFLPIFSERKATCLGSNQRKMRYKPSFKCLSRFSWSLFS